MEQYLFEFYDENGFFVKHKTIIAEDESQANGKADAILRKSAKLDDWQLIEIKDFYGNQIWLIGQTQKNIGTQKSPFGIGS